MRMKRPQRGIIKTLGVRTCLSLSLGHFFLPPYYFLFILLISLISEIDSRPSNWSIEYIRKHNSNRFL